MNKIIIIVGPTASGKSSLAIEASLAFNAEIVSADSVQIYRHMNIGTAKPTAAEQRLVPHHLIDILDPNEEYTVARFITDADNAINDIVSRGKNVIVAGGTGLYIRSLVEGLFAGPEADLALRDELYKEAQINGTTTLHDRLRTVDPKAASTIHPNNLRRIIRALEVQALTNRPISDFQAEHALQERRYDALKIGLETERALLYSTIDARVEQMIKAGLVNEVAALLKQGYSQDLKPMGALGYKEIIGYLNEEYPIEEALQLLKRNTRRYAKKQLTWFKKDTEIEWFACTDRLGIMKKIEEHLC